MPLSDTGDRPAYDARRKMIAMWMRIGFEPIGPIEGARVYVSLPALWNLEKRCAQTVDAALFIFDLYRHHIGIRAGNRFDIQGPEPGEFFRGRPVIVLTSTDLERPHVGPWF